MIVDSCNSSSIESLPTVAALKGGVSALRLGEVGEHDVAGWDRECCRVRVLSPGFPAAFPGSSAAFPGSLAALFGARGSLASCDGDGDGGVS